MKAFHKGIKAGLLCAAALAVVPLQAQTADQQISYSFGGSVLNRDMLWASDMAELGRTHLFGTARVMGMGGAFTSLGADLTSMALNPAGLGMYRSNELSLTPMVNVSHASTDGTAAWQNNNKTRFAFGNIGVALNVFESGSRSLTSLTIGLGLNRVADFNSRYSFSSESLYDPSTGAYMPTIGDIFSQQLNSWGVRPNSSNQLLMPDLHPSVWPAALGYDGYMVDYFSDGGANPWGVARIGGNASVLHSLDVVNSGSINEFDISLGANFRNVVYFGATLGIQSVYKRAAMTYQEEYGYFNTGGVAQSYNRDSKQWTNLTEQLEMMNLWQQMTVDGSGVNLKLGVVVRPVGGLRIGVAFHTPTYYSLEYTYKAGITTNSVMTEDIINNNGPVRGVQNGNDSPTASNEGPDSWNITSPARLMFGASYTFGNFAIVSVDYERDWYNAMRVKGVPRYNELSSEAYKAEFKQNFQATNSLRAGAEIKPLPMLAVRVGGGYTGSMLRDREMYTSAVNSGMPVTCESRYLSAGLGFLLSRTVSIDLAYQYVSDKLSRYQFFFSRNDRTGEMMTWSGAYDTSLARHYIAMSLNFRF